jgi:putative oxidoreductase
MNICHRLFAPGLNSQLTDFALLVLRLWFGLTLLLNHGWEKLTHFSEKSSQFPALLGLSSGGSLALAVFGEVFCAALLVIGLVTRFAALSLCINMAVAFALVHKMALSGQHSGELAFIYLAGFVTVLLAGPGRLSADACVFGKPPTLIA